MSNAQYPEELLTRHRENLAIFQQRIPQLVPILESHQPMGRLVEISPGNWDIAYDHVSLYGGRGGEAFCKEQLENFIEMPVRSTQKPPDTARLDKDSGGFITGVLRECREADLEFLSAHQGADGYFLFSFGLGLGQFLQGLIAQTRPKVVVIIEPNPDFLYFSTFIVDWMQIFAYCDSADAIEFRFIITTDPSDLVLTLKGIIRDTCPAAWDGALHYKHYSNTLIDTVFEQFNSTMMTTALLGLGFMEDELCMITQTRDNLLKADRPVVSANIREAVDAPALIVGNAPSLDQSLPHLKALQDKAIIFSCGSALPVLLDHGIRPDFQVVLERGPFQVESCSRAAKIAGLEDITLIGSTTVRPELIELFDDYWCFFRPCLSSTPIFLNHPHDSLGFTDPMAANAALNAALQIGFNSVYLVGVDLGSRDQSKDHSKAYVSPKGPNAPIEFQTMLPGNFGGDIHSHGVLMWSKDMLELTVSGVEPKRDLFNCSDGAAINGFLPKHISTVKPPSLPFDRTQFKQALRQRLPVYKADDMRQKYQAACLAEQVVAIISELKAVVEDQWDIGENIAITRIMRGMKLESYAHPAHMVLRGTLTLSMAALHFYSRRVRNTEELEQFREITKKLLLEYLEDLNKEVQSTLRT